MTDLVFADVSEWQKAVDWAAYAAVCPVAVARLSYGAGHVDLQAAANLAGMRAHLRLRGWYHYLTASDDPALQARLFCATLGHLEPGEFVVVDSEEGAGNQEARAAQFLAAVNQTLGLSPAQDIEYSGLNFVAAHGGWVPGVTRWVAAYQPDQPAVGEQLWQFTDARTFPGITAPCDATVFHGTVDQLANIVTPAEPPAPTAQEDPMLPIAIVSDGTTEWGVAFDEGAPAWKWALSPAAAPAWARLLGQTVVPEDPTLCSIVPTRG